MEYIYSVMLLNSLGNDVNEANITKILEACGASVDSAKVKSVVASLEGVDIQKVIEEASAMSVSAPVASAATPAESAAAPKEEAKKEEPEVDAAAGLGSLF